LLSADVLNVAVPELSRLPVPSVVLPAMKVTVPDAFPPPGIVTVAVNVTAWPVVDGLISALREVAVAALADA
jgi:hypothetical protein